MATTFKTFLNNDVTTTRTLLHEAIPVTGSIVSGTYSDENVKNFSHGIFQSVYDYPYLSSSANQIFDLSVGYSADSALSASSGVTEQSKKINMYNQMAQVLVGHDVTGAILKFDEDGNIAAGGTKLKECVFIDFSRLLYKDEIKKGSFSLELGVNATYGTPFTETIILADTNAANDYRVNSPAGEYAVLTASDGTGTPMASSGVSAGLIYYQAGIAVVTASVFGSLLTSPAEMNSAAEGIDAVLTGSAISGSCDAFRHRTEDIAFNNTTELNSTIYFCRVNNNDFNYSANPTYLSESKLRVKRTTTDAPVSYITTVGLYSDDNELLAVAKLSEPLRKDPTNEMILRVRLDY
jgi:hypothetical protein